MGLRPTKPAVLGQLAELLARRPDLAGIGLAHLTERKAMNA